MQRSFTYTLLITWLLLSGACKTQYIQNSVTSRNVLVSDTVNQLDSQLVQLYQPYKKKLEKDMSRVIAVSVKEMVKGKPESELTNFLADLLLEEGTRILKESGKNFRPDISYFNYGGIRTFLPEGEITVGKIYELIPFENQLVFLKLNGRQVQEFLDTIAEKGGDSVAGVRFAISNEKAVRVKVNGQPLQNDKTYWLATNDYVAQGGDDLDVFTERKDFYNSYIKIRNVIIAHMEELHKSGNLVTAQTDGRIKNE